MSVKHCIGDCLTPPKNPALTFSYQPDHFQNHSFNAMESGDHVLVTAHTGSGKTTVAEYAVAYGINSGKRVIYTAPIKALSNQIFGDFSRKYPEWSLGIKTGDIDFRSDDAQIVIMTTEILQNMLYKKDSDTEDDAAIPTIDFNNVAVVIFDEVHYIKDRDRGSVWERSIMMMPEHIQMIMLSATLPDAHQFCEWIADCKKKDVTHTTTPHRAVPLTHYIITRKGKELIMDKSNNFNDSAYQKAMKHYTFVPSELDDYIRMMKLPALFFCFSKKHCQAYTNQITVGVTTKDERMEIDKNIKYLVRKFPNHKEISETKQAQEIFRLAAKGVCYHHAGLLPPLKEIVQELFSMGLIKVLFVTETFAAGVNMPTKTVVFTGLTKYDDSTRDFRCLLPEEYGQMAGRAGRRGMDTEGIVIHMPFNVRHHPTQMSVKEMMCGKIRNIESRIKPSYHHFFNSIIYDGDKLATGSMLDRQLKGRMDFIDRNIEKTEEAYSEYLQDLEEIEQEVDEEFYSKLEYYQSYHNKSLSKKQSKEYIKSNTEEWYQNNKFKCDKLISLEKHITDIDNAKEKLQEEYTNLKEGFKDDMDLMAEFLAANNYVNGVKDIDEYQSCDVTVKGIMASGINEANPLLLTELIINDFFDDLDKYELLSVLALFLPNSSTERDIILPSKIQDTIISISRFAEELSVAESKFSPCISDWEIYQEYCDMTYVWTKSGQINTVYGKTGSTVQMGEFVRMMIKLNNICRETLKAAMVCQKDNLCMVLRECEEILIKGVIFPQSLYVSPSSKKNG